ncbi:putative KRR1 interacting protein [Helianthus debilis subsp. tardiflorus]
MGMKLFGDEGGESGDISKIEINQEFARRFEHNKKREDLQRYEELKKKGVIDDSEEDDESSDDDEEIVNYSTKQDLKFFDALIKVRNKDPLLKSNEAKLFDSDNEEDDDDEGGDGKKEKEKKKKPMFLKDVNAKHLIGNGPEFDDEDDERDDKNRKKSYFEEQEEVRKEFLDAVADEEDDDGELLKVKNDNTGGDEGEDEDDREFEKKLDEYFKEDDKLDENEKFLKDYFRKKMWLDKDSGKSKGFDIEIDVSEDEEELVKQEDYEREFNFRYEENAGDRVMGHSRKVDGSVRKKESSRKIQRMNKKERMAQAELERNEELKRLKNLKKKEMNEKLRKIREIAGFGENDDCLLDEHDLEEEFDPDEYDRKMKNTFGDNFYDADDVDPSFGSDEEHGELEKPDFDKEDDLLGLPKGWDDEHGSGDGFLAFREKILKKKVKNEGNEEQNEEQLQDEEGKRKRSKLEEELIKKSLEEMYKLECEGTIGDLKTRFRYKSVDKNTYGLKPKEILLVDEKELNQIVPLKKLATYREDEFVVPRHKLKEQKQKIKSLLRGESSDGHGHSDGGKKRKHDVGQTEPEKSKSDAENEEQNENEEQKELSRKQRRKMRSKEFKISDKRRMAYEGSTAKSNKKKKHKSKDAV